MSLQHVTLGQLIKPAKLCRASNGIFPILSMTMHEGLVEQSKKFKKRVASSDTSQYKIVQRNQLVVGFPIDEGVLSFQHLFDEAIVSPAYDIWDLRNGEKVDSRYLERFLRSPYALSFYISKLRGTTARRRTLPNDIFLSLTVPLPPLAEQKRIADILDRAEALRAKRSAALAQLDELTQAIFIDMFGDQVANPKGWSISDIENICELIVDCVNRTAPTVEEVTPFKMIRTSNVKGGVVNLLDVKYVTEEIFNRWNRRATPQRGDVLLTREAPVGEAGIINTDDKVFLGQRLMLYRVDPNCITPEYLMFSFRDEFLKHQFEKNGSGSTVKHLPLPVCRNLKIIVPPLTLQQEFTRRVGAIEKLKISYKASLAELDELFASLQYRALRGEL